MKRITERARIIRDRKILALYKIGYIGLHISKMMGVSDPTVRRVLYKNGIFPQEIMNTERTGVYSKIWDLYSQKHSYQEIAVMTGRKYNFIRYVIRRQRRIDGWTRPAREKTKSDRFDVVTPWLGKIINHPTIHNICALWDQIPPTEIAEQVSLPLPAILAVAREHDLYYGE